MTTLADLKAFNLAGSDVTVWTFKKPRSNGRHRFVGRWIGITDELAERLRITIASNLANLEETTEYDVLAQTHETSALTIQADETDQHLIAAQVTEPTPDLKIRDLGDLRDSEFYVARFSSSGTALMALRKTDDSWSTRKSGGVIRMVFSDDELDVEDAPVFTIKPDFDFFVLNENIFIRNKARFESLLAYKTSHAKAFQTLTTEPAFTAIFADVEPLTTFVGTNKIHLRRSVAIQQKGHYRDTDFMHRLRAECDNMNLNIAFDATGKIVATIDNGRDIFRALLDHRLESRLTSRMYDVPSAEEVG